MDLDEQRPADDFRDRISNALRGDGYFNDRIDLLYNGGWQPLYVEASETGLTLFKKSIYGDNTISYIMLNNMFTFVIESTEDIIYDLARFLDYEQIENILNLNRNQLASRHIQYVFTDEDKGFIPFIVFRVSNQDEFYINQPDANGDIHIDRETLENLLDLTEYDDINDFLTDHGDIEIDV